MAVPRIFGDIGELRDWEKRRSEIFRLLEEYEHGRTPGIRLDKVECFHNEHIEVRGGYVRDTYALVFTQDERSCGLQYVVFRKEHLETPAPSVFLVNPFSSNPMGYQRSIGSHNIIGEFPVRMLADAGFIAVDCLVDRICPDDREAYRHGIMEMAPPQGPDGWCAIGAWSWAVSRIIDRIVEDPLFDPRRITVSGCSRGGKTALWCGASDRRIAAVFAAVSGCCGAAMHRGKSGETIQEITGRFPHWSCARFKEFRDREEELPLDQHMLLSLIAPRPLYITSASDDDWADPHKEFESCVRVSELYEALGGRGLSSMRFPAVNTPIADGDVGYHLREGGHGCTPYDWEQVIRFLKGKLGIGSSVDVCPKNP